jgi:hypothetical protein
MAEFIGIVGPSGTGKSTSYGQIPEIGNRGLNPETTVIINVADKPLPFRGWKNIYNPEIKITNGGNYISTADYSTIVKVIKYISESRPEINNIVIEDMQYMMAFEFMARASEAGYKKFSDLGVHFNKVRDAITTSRPNMKVFALWHPEVNAEGKMKMKTCGKMIDDYLTPEGLFTIILYTKVEVDSSSNIMKYTFVTNNDGQYPAKSPIGMFNDRYIPNDLDAVVESIDRYYEGE